MYEALVLGTRDYLRKNGFTDAVIGLSGGSTRRSWPPWPWTPSGPDHVHGLSMPSRYSSAGSVTDADGPGRAPRHRPRAPCPSRPPTAPSRRSSPPALGDAPAGLTDENLQSRIRGVLLMAVSNARGWIVLTTGNKSELATGYSTLYGDSAGGFAVIKDVPEDPRLPAVPVPQRPGRDASSIPEAVLTKAPSAELRPDQRDDQSLPPYEVLDPLLEALVLHDRSIADVVASGYDPELVVRVAALVDGAEYKRRQSPPGVRITAKAFGKDRRMPITNRYRDPAPETTPARRSGRAAEARRRAMADRFDAAALALGGGAVDGVALRRGPALSLEAQRSARRVVPVGRAPALRGARLVGGVGARRPRRSCCSTSTASSTPGTPSCSPTGSPRSIPSTRPP